MLSGILLRMAPPHPLVEAHELAALLRRPDVRVADVRWKLNEPGAGRRAFEAGHIPGAIFLDVDRDLAAPPGAGRHPLPDPRELARTLGAHGIGDGNLVVVADDSGGTIGARLWWMLEHLGHRNVRLLDGGYVAWIGAGLPIERGEHPWPPAQLTLEERWAGTIDRPELAARLGSVMLLDVRAPERYRGEIEPIDPVAGHIPTARSAPTTANLGPDGRFLPPEALRARFVGLGAGSDPVVAYCGSGINACHTILAMRVAGLPEPILYPGSYSDWSRAGMPVVTGAEPGKPPGRAATA